MAEHQAILTCKVHGKSGSFEAELQGNRPIDEWIQSMSALADKAREAEQWRECNEAGCVLDLTLPKYCAEHEPEAAVIE